MKVVRVPGGFAGRFASLVDMGSYRRFKRARPTTGCCRAWPGSWPNSTPRGPPGKSVPPPPTGQCTALAKPFGSALMWWMRPGAPARLVEPSAARRFAVARSAGCWPAARCACGAGAPAGDLAIADTLAAGTYELRAYTNWMRNAGEAFVYSRHLSVWPASPLGPSEPPASTAGARGKTAFARAAAAAGSTRRAVYSRRGLPGGRPAGRGGLQSHRRQRPWPGRARPAAE